MNSGPKSAGTSNVRTSHVLPDKGEQAERVWSRSEGPRRDHVLWYSVCRQSPGPRYDRAHDKRKRRADLRSYQRTSERLRCYDRNRTASAPKCGHYSSRRRQGPSKRRRRFARQGSLGFAPLSVGSRLEVAQLRCSLRTAGKSLCRRGGLDHLGLKQGALPPWQVKAGDEVCDLAASRSVVRYANDSSQLIWPMPLTVVPETVCSSSGQQTLAVEPSQCSSTASPAFLGRRRCWLVDLTHVRASPSIVLAPGLEAPEALSGAQEAGKWWVWTPWAESKGREHSGRIQSRRRSCVGHSDCLQRGGSISWKCRNCRTDRHSEIDRVEDNRHPLGNGLSKLLDSDRSVRDRPSRSGIKLLADVQAAAAYSRQAADERLSSRGKRSCWSQHPRRLECGLHRHGRRRPCPLPSCSGRISHTHCSHHHGMGMSLGNEFDRKDQSFGEDRTGISRRS